MSKCLLALEARLERRVGKKGGGDGVEYGMDGKDRELENGR